MIQARQLLVVNGSQNRADFPAFCGAITAHPAHSYNCLQVRFPISNLVGYNTVKITANRSNLLAVSFDKVGTTQASLNDVMDVSKLTPYDLDAGEFKDYIDLWDLENGTWLATYFYVDAPDISEDYVKTWMTADTTPLNPVVETGSSLWLYHYGEDIPDFQFMGQLTSGVKGYTLVGGRSNLCGNPYPTELNLCDKSQVVITGATPYDVDMGQFGDYIDTWDNTKATWKATYFYVDAPQVDPQYADTWMDADTNPVESTEIAAGTGFWYFAVNNGVSLSFVNPVK